MTHRRRRHGNQKRGRLELSNIVPARLRVLRKRVYIKKEIDYISRDNILGTRAMSNIVYPVKPVQIYYFLLVSYYFGEKYNRC